MMSQANPDAALLYFPSQQLSSYATQNTGGKLRICLLHSKKLSIIEIEATNGGKDCIRSLDEWSQSAAGSLLYHQICHSSQSFKTTWYGDSLHSKNPQLSLCD